MIRVFFLLLLANGLLIFIHYNEAKNVTAGSAIELSYGQEIEIMNRVDGLHVRHHFTQLPDNRLEIVWPEDSIDRACYLEDADACLRLNESSTVFEAGDAESQSVSYVIPNKGSKGGALFFKDIFAKLHNTPVSTTIMHITDEMGLKGLWVNGLAQLGNKKMDLVDYSLFKGSGEVTDLYWQKVDQPLLYGDDEITVYGSANMDITESQFQEMIGALKVTEAPHSAIVLSGDNGEVNSDRFTITSDLENAIDRMLINHLHNQYQLPTDDRWTTEIISSLLSGQAVGSDIAHSAYSLLSEFLTTNELEQMANNIREKRVEKLSADELGKVFEEVTGLSTSFFEKNSQATDKLYPLLLTDVRGLYIPENDRLENGVILKEGNLLYPATEILSGLGYQISKNEQSLYIESATKSYRFPLKEKFYVYNDKRFDVMSIPFEQIDDEFYFAETMLIRIFHLEIEKTEEKIIVNPIAVLGEEKI